MYHIDLIILLLLKHLLFFFSSLCLENFLVRKNESLLALVNVDDLNFESLASECVEIFNILEGQLRSGNESAHAVDGGDDIIVFDVIGAFGIAVALLGGVGLVDDAGHTPALGGIVVLVVDHNGHVVTVDIHGGDVVHHLLAVGGHSVVDILADTGGQHRGGGGEHGEVAVLRLLLVVALVALTGGIVRGMSGSPIIQDGKLIGAVTHVLVNDPTRGYGIFIENMLNAAQKPMARAA